MTIRNFTKLIIVAGCLSLAAWYFVIPFIALPSHERLTADANNLTQVDLGKKVYVEHCASCHGANLEGQPNWRSQLPEGGLPAPPHDATGHTWHHPDKLNFEYTKFGGQKIAPPGFKSNMPGFEETLSDSQIWAVLGYIKSRWPEKIRRQHDRINKANQ